MSYTIKNMDDKILKEIINWKYEGKYNEYNLDSYEELKKRNSSLINPDKAQNYLCYFKNNRLIGYTNLVEKDNGTLFLGIGLAPQNCGKGIGKELLLDTINKAREKYKSKQIVLQVRSWNIRAINCYKKVGFEIVKKESIKDYKGNIVEYVFMSYNI